VLFRSSVFLKWYHPDIVWISSPELFEYLPKNLSSRLIYDCMDDVLAFPRNASRRDSLAANEKELINACSYVFCSSDSLRDKIVARVGQPEKCFVINNAFEPSAFSCVLKDNKTEKKKGRYVLGYIGTISSWFDFEALIRIVNEFNSMEIHLIGPVENLGIDLPQHERIKYLGAMRHGDVQMHASEFDALLMPFYVTELIQSVNPVKLYEYVFFNKPIVSVRYKEIERFSEFVDFYTDHHELIAIINRYLCVGFRKKYSDAQRLQFIGTNTWADRANQIQKYIANLLQDNGSLHVR
jgi:teichuronic acid biosynthesis glycosyltransferase TuaH